MLKNDDDGNSTDREDYLEKLNEDLSCGDTIKNTEFSETDDKSKTGKRRDTAKIAKKRWKGGMVNIVYTMTFLLIINKLLMRCVHIARKCLI